MTLTGTRADNTTFSKLLTVTAHNATTTNDFTPFAFTDLTNLKSLQFLSTTNYIAIDDIMVNAVPEPATLALMGLGLAGLGHCQTGIGRLLFRSMKPRMMR